MPHAEPTNSDEFRVLIVEDNPANQRVMELIVTQLGYRTVLAADGVEAIGLVARETFDVILMDLHMPRLDGFSAALAIRAMPEGDMPIIAVTADGSPGVERRVREVGMDAYLAKPVAIDLMADLLARATSGGRDAISPIA